MLTCRKHLSEREPARCLSFIELPYLVTATYFKYPANRKTSIRFLMCEDRCCCNCLLRYSARNLSKNFFDSYNFNDLFFVFFYLMTQLSFDSSSCIVGSNLLLTIVPISNDFLELFLLLLLYVCLTVKLILSYLRWETILSIHEKKVNVFNILRLKKQ